MKNTTTILALALVAMLFVTAMAEEDHPVGDWEYRDPYLVDMHWSDSALTVPLNARIRVDRWAYALDEDVVPQEYRVDGGSWRTAGTYATLAAPGGHQVDVRGFTWEIHEETHQRVQLPFSRAIAVTVMGIEAHGVIMNGADSRAPYFSVTHLAGGDDPWDQPLLVVEGFDPSNVKDIWRYYALSPEFFETLRGLGRDVLFLNFEDGGRDMALNADVLERTITMIHEASGGRQLTVAGLSMGGVISRYALARAEHNGTPLPVSHFLSLDSPQQGAVVHAAFQRFLRDNGQAPASLSSVAARQLLQYSAYTSLHDAFYGTLNGLNGDGYPHQCRTVGVTFAPAGMAANPWVGRTWARFEVSGSPICDAFGDDRTFEIANDLTAGAGSLLPHSNQIDDWGDDSSCGWLLEFLNDGPNGVRPTFIPRASALDLDAAGNSRFDVTIQPRGVPMANGTYGPYGHDEFPTEPAFVLAILDALDIPLFDRVVAGTFGGCDGTVIRAQHSLSNVDGTGQAQAVLFQAPSGCTARPALLACGRDIRLAARVGAGARIEQGVELTMSSDPALDVVGSPAGAVAIGRVGARDFELAAKSTRTPVLRAVLEQNKPNPFNPSTEIAFTLDRSGWVRLRVFDLRGRLVCDLVDATMDAGPHAVTWNGRDSAGRPAQSGMYVYRIEGPGISAARKMMLLK